MIRVQIPYHLQTLARLEKREVDLPVEAEPTIGSVLDALEARYPMLRGTLRDQVTGRRRDFIRFFACGQDWSLEAYETPLPEAVVVGREPFRIVGAMAGG
ncbi:MAG: MoaD/ThiS family protein [Chloroflexi bacterium]|nr:MoaD/ThiS family protein [Chloroflexota bacterium]